jgi:hypothetical protein
VVEGIAWSVSEIGLAALGCELDEKGAHIGACLEALGCSDAAERPVRRLLRLLNMSPPGRDTNGPAVQIAEYVWRRAPQAWRAAAVQREADAVEQLHAAAMDVAQNEPADALRERANALRLDSAINRSFMCLVLDTAVCPVDVNAKIELCSAAALALAVGDGAANRYVVRACLDIVYEIRPLVNDLSWRAVAAILGAERTGDAHLALHALEAMRFSAPLNATADEVTLLISAADDAARRYPVDPLVTVPAALLRSRYIGCAAALSEVRQAMARLMDAPEWSETHRSLLVQCQRAVEHLRAMELAWGLDA